MGTEFKDLDSEGIKNILRRAAGEFFSTALLIFLGCMGAVGGLSSAPDRFGIAFNFGVAVMTGLMCFSHISGAHMNPGLSLTSLIMGNLSLPMFVIYTISQCLGATFGYAVLMGMTPEQYLIVTPGVPDPNFCCNSVNPKLSNAQAFFSEFVLSAVLSLVACGVWDRRSDLKHESVSFRFGMSVFSLAYGGMQYSGCSMNPARSFGPALLWNHWDNQWLYWVAPMLANLVVATSYVLMFPYPTKATTE